MYRKLLIQWKGLNSHSRYLSPGTITIVNQGHLLGGLDHLLNRVIIRHSHYFQEVFKVDILLDCIAAFQCLKTSPLLLAFQMKIMYKDSCLGNTMLYMGAIIIFTFFKKNSGNRQEPVTLFFKCQIKILTHPNSFVFFCCFIQRDI